MCISINELNSRVAEVRSLKALLEETENAIKALEYDIKDFMTVNFIKEDKKPEYIGTDYKITFNPQTRTTLDRERLEADLGSRLEDYEKVSSFNVLRIK